jgi:hypothetical protein
MASPTSSPLPTSGNDPTVPDEDHGVDLPMSMTASVILTNLPKDASQALADVEALDDRKGTKTSISLLPYPVHSNIHPITPCCTVVVYLSRATYVVLDGSTTDVFCGLTVA